MSVLRWSSPLLALVFVLGACGRPGDAPEADALEAETRTSGQAATTTPEAAATTPSTTVAGPGESGGGSVDQVTSDTDPTSTASSPSTIVSTTTTSTPATSTPATSGSAAPPTTSAAVAPVAIRLRIDRRVGDAATEDFASVVRATLTDERGWAKAGYAFSFDDAAFEYTIVLAEGPEVDQLCLPYDTFGRFSCQIGPIVALNADRWRTAVDSWPASLDAYRAMLINHEVGHLLGQHHPATRCPGDGQPAPVMAQQSSGVAPCTANPWPLAWEISCAEQRLEPLAPPFERDISLTCGPDGPVG